MGAQATNCKLEFVDFLLLPFLGYSHLWSKKKTSRVDVETLVFWRTICQLMPFLRHAV